MAVSAFDTSQFSSEEFVESCGAITFDFSGPNPQVCLVHYTPKNEWLLAKGRRNCDETRQAAALRETEEETGYRCRLLPINLSTRCPAASEEDNVPDEPRSYPNITEPFMLNIRRTDGEEANVKLIWWYIAVVENRNLRGDGEEKFKADFINIDDAVQRLTFEDDRKVLERAINLVHSQMPKG